MRRFVSILAVVTALMALATAPAGAITGNYVEDTEHPFVGLVVFYDADGEFSHRCSGSLISPTVLLTAGHCTDGVESARVYFQQDAGANYDPETQLDPVSGYPETCAPGTLGEKCATSDELYNLGFADFAGFPNTGDAGLVILDQEIVLPEYGELPEVGALDPLFNKKGTQDRTVLASGYGLTYSSPVGVVSFRERLMAYGQVINLNSANNGGFNVQTNGNGNGKGGTCSGDSGGPIFYPADSNTIVAVTSFGLNSWCRGVDFAYRVDTQDVQDWIAEMTGE